MSNTTNTAGVDLDKLEALARAARQERWEMIDQGGSISLRVPSGYHLFVNTRWANDKVEAVARNIAAFIGALDPATVSQLIQLARASLAQQAGALAERDDRMWNTNTVMSYLATLPGALDRTRANNVDDVLNALILMHRELPAAAPATAAQADQDAPNWSKEPPTEQGEYWNWDGDEDHAPMIYHVLWSGTAKKCFVSMGQYDIKNAIWCDEFGGWWLKIEQPSISAGSAAIAVSKEGA